MALCNLNLTLIFPLFLEYTAMLVVKNRLTGSIGELYDDLYVQHNQR